MSAYGFTISRIRQFWKADRRDHDPAPVKRPRKHLGLRIYTRIS
jgi:hypothetical protein